MKIAAALPALALFHGALAVKEWYQCGGVFGGMGECDPGLVCVIIIPFYWQCQKAAPGQTTTDGRITYSPWLTTSATTTSTTTTEAPTTTTEPPTTY